MDNKGSGAISMGPGKSLYGLHLKDGDLLRKWIRDKIRNPINIQDSEILWRSEHRYWNTIFYNFVSQSKVEIYYYQHEEFNPGSADHIFHLLKKELGLPIKLAHQLNNKVLAPKSIEKVKVNLAEHFFRTNEASTVGTTNNGVVRVLYMYLGNGGGTH
ncbi:unnamed protein product [Lepeophtheirus salmonis]|uniref:(salmon louse) hypothetical protein n=1 Tax=Lepeophtheirus salmonis TaxID=72036 RepID=A0A7R8CLP7_LEPSM|nr:unnamed protein product [Lepeophtheirus salmonis]CAF2858952.1 unnamed protein product [Lepeophtheirus salmonis]